jgi:pyrroline-5-carboxylate reductase
MPKILERLKDQLVAKGMPKSNAYAIATSQLQKHGVLKKGTQDLTPKGTTRNAMTPSERAKDRAAQASKHKAGDYGYSVKTNRATLKKR